MLFGSWEPGGFPPGVTLAAKIALMGSMLVRGADLLSGDAPETARRLTAVESAAPIWVWGVFLMAGAVVGFVSFALRSGRGVLSAHLVGTLGYCLLSVGIVADVAARNEVSWQGLVWPSVVLLVGAVASVVACRVSTWQHVPLAAAGTTVSVTFAVAAIELDGLRAASILLTVGIIHGLMAIGTAAHLRQAKIEREGAHV